MSKPLAERVALHETDHASLRGGSTIDTDQHAEAHTNRPHSDNRLGVWLRVLGIIVAIPFILAALWLFVFVLSQIIPDCEIDAGPGTCFVAGIDLKVPLFLLAAPAFFSWLFAPFWIAALLAWLAFGAFALGIGALMGRGLFIHRRWLLQGDDMRSVRKVVYVVLATLYVIVWFWGL